MFSVLVIPGPKEETVHLPVSKSIFNRVAIIKALCGANVETSHDMPEDCVVLSKAVSSSASTIDIGHSGTAMRFLTAYFCTQDREVILRGSERMHNRPIGLLVDALRQLGAEISYVENEGFPPLRISRTKIAGGQVTLSGAISSQFITAILLIAPHLDNGLQLNIEEPIVSKPYIDMTLSIMKKFGIQFDFSGTRLTIPKQKYVLVDYQVEKDWSAASFWYEFTALHTDTKIFLPGLTKQSLQGDTALIDLYATLGVCTMEYENGLILTREHEAPNTFEVDCEQFPDLAQPLAFTCAGLGVHCHLTGLQTLQIKETKRIDAIATELEKIGIAVSSSDEALSFSADKIHTSAMPFETYNDHRMAMSTAPLCAVLSEVVIRDPNVVIKSYPSYWKDLSKFCAVKEIKGDL